MRKLLLIIGLVAITSGFQACESTKAMYTENTTVDTSKVDLSGAWKSEKAGKTITFKRVEKNSYKIDIAKGQELKGELKGNTLVASTKIATKDIEFKFMFAPDFKKVQVIKLGIGVVYVKQ